MVRKNPEHMEHGVTIVPPSLPPGDCEINVGKTEHGVAYIQVKTRNPSDTAQLFDFVRYRLGTTSPRETAWWDTHAGPKLRSEPLKVPKPKHK